ncbi:ABC transporter substrate-binding protein [Aeromonas bivalvium]|uniref:ABC transporter substrate-binding protein n=1 Tax=Aeromonas bivalvium TaxID=440079 RepID=UPI0038D145AF
MLANLSRVATACMLGSLMLAAPQLHAADGTTDNKTVLTLVAQQETAWVKNFNPFLQAGLLHTTKEFIYEPLVIFNELQGGRPEFRLATQYEFSKDLTSVIFDLRQGVKWSDGEGFDADDVIFSFNLVKAHKALDERAIWTQISGVEKLDQYKVKFDLVRVNTGVVNQIALVPLVPEHQWKTVKDPVAFTNDQPVGTGPFTQVDNFSAQLYTQCRNPHYWDNANLAIDCIRMPQMATNDQVLAAVMKGDVDWFGSFVPDIERLYVGNDPKHNKYWFPASGTVAFNVNFQTKDPGNHEAFNDINFRRAFSMAMDRQSMVDIAGYGYPTINEYPSGLGKLFDSWNNPEVDQKYGKFNKFDMAAAQALLKQAGYKDCDGDSFLDTPSCKKIAFKIIVPNGWTDWVNTVQIGVEGLKALGIDAKTATPEAAVWTDNLVTGDFDVALQGYLTGANPQNYFETAFHSRNMGERGNRFAAPRYQDPALDKLIDGFSQTADLAKQKAIMNEIQERVGANQTIIPVYNNPTWYEYNTKRFHGWFNADNPVAKPQVHSNTPERLLHVLALKPNV